MMRILEVGLVGAVVLAAAAFGGTEMPTISIVQIVILGLGISLLLKFDSLDAGSVELPILFPAVLTIFVFAQWVHIPNGISIAPYETLSHLLLWVTYLAVFYTTVVVARQSGGGRRIVSGLLGLGALEAGYGLFQYLTGWQRIFQYAKEVNLNMATGTYIDYDHFAGLLEMILPFALAIACVRYRKMILQSRRSSGSVRNLFRSDELPKLILWLSLGAVLFLAIVFSQSRMGLISAMVSSLLLFILVATSGWQTGFRRIAVATMTLAFFIVAASLAAWIGADPVMARFENLGEQYASSTDTRLEIWKDSIRLIETHPWAGTGLGTFSIAYPQVQTAFEGRLVSHAHNDYLEFASELGIPAALLLFGAVFYLIMKTASSARGNQAGMDSTIALGCFGSLVSISLHSLTDFNLQIPANALLFAVILGLAYANTRNRRPAESAATMALRT
jgi:O-antigen ligase